MTREFQYRAFISYSHRDERWATWLHKALERYRVPDRLVGRVTAAGPVPARIAPVFRDSAELPTASDLGRIVNAALEESAALIVICSPHAAQSRWVNEEVRVFRRLGRSERIFCLIVDGDPAGPGDQQCFPDALRHADDSTPGAREIEPIAADVRPGISGHGKGAALLKLVAGLLGVGLDELVRRDQQRRQRRLLAITVAAVAGMTFASLLAALALMARNEAERERARAETEAATAQQTAEFLVELFAVVDPSEARGNTITAREILDRGVVRIDRDLGSQPQVRANLMQTMGRVYTGLGLYETATDLLRRAYEVRAEIERGPTREGIATANALGAALYEKGEYAEAEAIYGDALTAARALFPEGDPLLTEAMNGSADLLNKKGEFAAAEAEYAAALEIDRRLHGDVHPDVARSLAGLAAAQLYQEHFAQSEAAFREALDIRRQTLGDDHPLVAWTLNNLASVLYFSGQAQAAEPFFREAAALYAQVLGHEHPFVSSIENNLGRLLLEQGDLTAADEFLSSALATDRKLKDPGHDDFVYSLNNLGLVRLGLGDVEAALALFEEARAIGENYDHRMLGQIWANLADVYWRLGRDADAAGAITAARPRLIAAHPDEPWHLANLGSLEGALRVAAGDLAGAEQPLLENYAIIAQRWGERGLFTRLAAERVSRFYQARGEPELEGRYRRIAAGG